MKKTYKKILLFLFIFLITKNPVNAEIISNGSVAIPIGTIQAFTGTTVPDEYLLADGSAISRITYKQLYEIIQTIYGSGDGTNTFNLPNLNGRVVVGQSTEDEFNIIGKKGGEISHKLTVAEMPSHTHIFTGTSHTHTFIGNSVSSGTPSTNPTATFNGTSTSTSTAGGHGGHVPASLVGKGEATYYLPVTSATQYGTDRPYVLRYGNELMLYTRTLGAHAHSVVPSGSVSLANTNHTHTFTSSGSNASTTVGGTNIAAGLGEAHNNLQPYIVLKYIIKYK